MPVVSDLVNIVLEKKIHKLIANKNIKIISFDIYDTLVTRTLEKPSDIHLFTHQMVLEKSDGRIANFHTIRIQSEKEARKYCCREISLSDIYNYINNIYIDDISFVKEIMEYELLLEEKFLTQYKLGFMLYEVARSYNKKVIAISDMYLSSNTIISFLKKYKYDLDEIYISCEYGCSKGNGLYSLVLDDLNVDASSILHIGDNYFLDYLKSKAHGFHSYHIENISSKLSKSELLSIFYSNNINNVSKSRSMILGTIALKIFSNKAIPNSLFQGSPYLFGYIAFGPILFSYVLWLINKCKQDKINCVYFLSREGYILKKTWDLLANEFNIQIKSCYLHISRRAINIATLYSQNDVMQLALEPCSPNATIPDILYHRFGLYLDDVNISSKKINNNYPEYLNIVSRFSERILLNAKMERDAYCYYLKKNNFFEDDKCAVIDIGWMGNVQTKLGLLTHKKIFGYYFSTKEGSDNIINIGHNISVYNSFSSYFDYSCPLLSDRKFAEFLFCSDAKSLRNVSIKNNKIMFCYEDEKNYHKRAVLTKKIHSGALDFANDMYIRYSNFIKYLYINPNTASAILKFFVNNASSKDRDIFKNVYYENNFSGYKAYICNSIRKKRLHLLLETEKILIKIFTTNKKQKKYLKNRSKFFLESKHRILKMYGKITS